MSGQFVSPDGVQGNAQGMDPYAYVSGNPETRTDPTGQRDCVPNGDGIECGNPGGGGTTCYEGDCNGGSGGGGTPNPCAAGPQSFNNCIYSSGRCDTLTYSQCQTKIREGQQKAKDLATNRAKETFHDLAIAFGVVAAILGVLAFLALVIPIFGEIWAGIFAGAALAFGSLAVVADLISGDFENEGGEPLSWFTTGNLEAQKESMLSKIAGGFDFGALSGALANFAYFMRFKIPDSPFEAGYLDTLGSKEAVENTVHIASGLAFLASDVVSYLAGAAIMTHYVLDYTSQQEQFVAGP